MRSHNGGKVERSMVNRCVTQSFLIGVCNIFENIRQIERILPRSEVSFVTELVVIPTG